MSKFNKSKLTSYSMITFVFNAQISIFESKLSLPSIFIFQFCSLHFYCVVYTLCTARHFSPSAPLIFWDHRHSEFRHHVIIKYPHNDNDRSGHLVSGISIDSGHWGQAHLGWSWRIGGWAGEHPAWWPRPAQTRQRTPEQILNRNGDETQMSMSRESKCVSRFLSVLQFYDAQILSRLSQQS